MADRWWRRVGAAGGFMYVLLAVLGDNVLGSGGGGATEPGPFAPSDQIVAWLKTLQGYVPHFQDWASLYLEMLGLLAFVAFAAYLYRLLSRAEGPDGWLAPAMFGAALISLSIKLISLPFGLAMFYRASAGLDPQVGTALLDINNLCFVLTWAVDGFMLGALGVASLRCSALPGWLSWSAIVLCPLMLAAVVGSTGPGFLAMMLFLIWVVAASITLVVRAGREVSPITRRPRDPATLVANT